MSANPFTNGPGKYDSVATTARLAAQAEGVVLIVFNGRHGQGFSAQLPGHLLLTVPDILRRCADDIDAQLRRAGES